MKNVFIYTDGCELRLIDAKKISNYLSVNKYQIIDNPNSADIIIYITCAFLERATEISFNLALIFTSRLRFFENHVG